MTDEPLTELKCKKEADRRQKWGQATKEQHRSVVQPQGQNEEGQSLAGIKTAEGWAGQEWLLRVHQQQKREGTRASVDPLLHEASGFTVRVCSQASEVISRKQTLGEVGSSRSRGGWSYSLFK